MEPVGALTMKRRLKRLSGREPLRAEGRAAGDWRGRGAREAGGGEPTGPRSPRLAQRRGRVEVGTDVDVALGTRGSRGAGPGGGAPVRRLAGRGSGLSPFNADDVNVRGRLGLLGVAPRVTTRGAGARGASSARK